jgi:hypothetical protein
MQHKRKSTMIRSAISGRGLRLESCTAALFTIKLEGIVKWEEATVKNNNVPGSYFWSLVSGAFAPNSENWGEREPHSFLART